MRVSALCVADRTDTIAQYKAVGTLTVLTA